jgi:hypothetical protein
MDHASPQRPDLLERGLHITDAEVRQRGRVARPGTTFVNANRRTLAMALPAATFGLTALGQVDAEQPRPEPKRAIGLISRKLDQAKRSLHAADDNRAACHGALSPAVSLLWRSGMSPKRA